MKRFQSLNSNYIYNPMTDDVTEINGGIGKLYEYKDGVKGHSLHWLLFQTFLGDPVDCYTPKPFSIDDMVKNPTTKTLKILLTRKIYYISGWINGVNYYLKELFIQTGKVWNKTYHVWN